MVEEAALPNMEVTMTGGEGERERRGDRCTISRVGGWRERLERERGGGGDCTFVNNCEHSISG